MRISDLSSDVCSSDLEPGALVVVEVGVVHRQHRHRPAASGRKRRHLRGEGGLAGALQAGDAVNAGAAGQRIIEAAGDEVGWKARCDAGVRTRGHRATRSDELRVGKEGVSTCRSRWSPVHKKKMKT